MERSKKNIQKEMNSLNEIVFKVLKKLMFA